ncbi:hypothetical protein N7454_008934 [Penicillium verhagenii]|nr:hypothetical protein N7454_008934 [Penicillium verhagenii]
MRDADDEVGTTPDDIGILHWKMIATPKNCKDTRNAWDTTGAMKFSRMPRGKTPVARAHGVLWLYMIGSYVLLGDRFAQFMPWRLGNSRSRDYNDIKIGYIAIHPDTPEDYSQIIENDVHHHDGRTDWAQQRNFTHMNTSPYLLSNTSRHEFPSGTKEIQNGALPISIGREVEYSNGDHERREFQICRSMLGDNRYPCLPCSTENISCEAVHPRLHLRLLRILTRYIDQSGIMNFNIHENFRAAIEDILWSHYDMVKADAAQSSA